MNDLTVRQQAHQIMLKVGSSLEHKMAMAATPFGHTPFQIERFVLNDNEYPKANGAKYRQCVRELWARMEAYHQNRDQYESLLIDLDEAKHELGKWIVSPFARRRAALRVKQIERNLVKLQMLLEHNIMPETEQFLRIAKESAPEDAKVFDFANEWKVWKHRATAQPKLKELIGPEPKGDDDGKRMG